jgi:nitrogen regulatory protein PII
MHVCDDEIASILMKKIIDVCNTAQTGDGLVWYTPVHKAFFIPIVIKRRAGYVLNEISRSY